MRGQSLYLILSALLYEILSFDHWKTKAIASSSEFLCVAVCSLRLLYVLSDQHRSLCGYTCNDTDKNVLYITQNLNPGTFALTAKSYLLQIQQTFKVQDIKLMLSNEKNVTSSLEHLSSSEKNDVNHNSIKYAIKDIVNSLHLVSNHNIK